LQEDVIHRKQQVLVDKPVKVLIDQVNEDVLGWSIGRHGGQAPDIDGVTCLANPKQVKLKPGDMVLAMVTHYEGYDLYADITKKVRT
jgi:tRNA A37 methylthiotransferase MiaB